MVADSAEMADSVEIVTDAVAAVKMNAAVEAEMVDLDVTL